MDFFKLNANGRNDVPYTKEELDLIKRVSNVRVKMLAEHPFFGRLLQNARFAVSKKVKTACTDGEYILYGLDFCSRLSDEGLYFVTFHEIMHIVLGHCFRGDNYDQFLFNVACDIVINSQIIYELDVDELDLGFAGKLMHLTPDGKEGRDYTAEEVYAMLCDQADKKGKKSVQEKYGVGDDYGEGCGSSSDDEDDSQSGGSDGNKNDGKEKEGKEIAKSGDSKKDGKEEKYGSQKGDSKENAFDDDHSLWGKVDDGGLSEQQWKYRIEGAAEVVENMKNGWGNSENMAARLIEKIKNPPLDWRTILQNFIQDEINDYSFSPPDKRFQDSPFLLPDFNEPDETPKDIWVVIDASGSVSNRELGMAYNEIAGAIEQFNGRFEGLLSYFSWLVTKPQPFSSVGDLDKIQVKGNGGTSFINIFKYLKDEAAFTPTCIIIITDGYAEYPKEKDALGIPVLWLLNNDRMTPPWGEVARMKTK